MRRWFIAIAMWSIIGLPVVAGASEDTAGNVAKIVRQVENGLESNPTATVDRLNESWLNALEEAQEFRAVEALSEKGTAVVAGDTWRIEQLQKHRVRALIAEGNGQGALHAAKGLFNVCSLDFTKEALLLLVDAMRAAYPSDLEIVPKFKLQVLANAQEDPAERKRLLEKYGGNSVMESIPADPEPWAGEIEKRRGLTDYRGMYGRGNLLLMAGRIKEAHEVFMQVYKIAPAGELKYASEGVAKLIKAEDGGLGKANQFVMSIRPKESGQ